jgi:hypothetical protein
MDLSDEPRIPHQFEKEFSVLPPEGPNLLSEQICSGVNSLGTHFVETLPSLISHVKYIKRRQSLSTAPLTFLLGARTPTPQTPTIPKRSTNIFRNLW